MTDYLQIESGGLRGYETATNLHALESYAPGTSIPTAILVEPFNNLTNWTTVAGVPAIATGRTGNGAALPFGAHIRYPIPAPSQDAVLTIGFAFRVSVSPSSINGNFLQFLSDTAATTHDILQLQTTGGLLMMRAPFNGIGTAAPTNTIVANTWAYIELQINLHDTTGAFTLRVNNSVAASGSSVDTKNGGTKTVFDAVSFIGMAGGTTNIDDLYLKVGAGQTFEGDTAIT